MLLTSRGSDGTLDERATHNQLYLDTLIRSCQSSLQLFPVVLE